MTRSAGRNELVGDLRAKGTEEIEVAHKEGQMRVVGHRIQSIDFQRKPPPILKKLPHHGKRQLAVAQLSHEGALVNFLVGVLVERRIEIVDVGLSFPLG